MRMIVRFAMAASLVGASSLAVAEEDTKKEEKAKKKASYHCEVTKDGEHTDLPDVKDRESCKKAGGKWQKNHDDGHEGHSDGDEHKD